TWRSGAGLPSGSAIRPIRDSFAAAPKMPASCQGEKSHGTMRRVRLNASRYLKQETVLFPDHFLAVRATVGANREDEFNRWYNSEHIPDVVNMFPACLGASRFKVMDGDRSHQYIALYAFRTAEELMAAINSPEIKGANSQARRDRGQNNLGEGRTRRIDSSS